MQATRWITSNLQRFSWKAAYRFSNVSLTSLRRQRSQSPFNALGSLSCTWDSKTSPPICVRQFQTSARQLSQKKYKYGISASYTAKDVKFNPARHVYNFQPETANAPEWKSGSNRRFESGQDAFFVSRVHTTEDIAFGVADGVGGWVDSGVDPADFSHGLCSFMAQTASNASIDSSTGSLSAQGLLQNGYDQLVKDGSIYAGGSTACIAIAHANGTLDVANLGDSGFLQLRLNAVHHYSEPQIHAFNTPYQLSVIPEPMRARTAAFGGVQLQDFPKDAAVSEHDLRHGDVLVFATDGVWDNLSSSDILRFVSQAMIGAKAWKHTSDGISVTGKLGSFTGLSDEKAENSAHSLQSFLATGLTREAKVCSMNPKRESPFGREVKKYYPEEDWRGGKVDDICVVVVVVVEEGK